LLGIQGTTAAEWNAGKKFLLLEIFTFDNLLVGTDTLSLLQNQYKNLRMASVNKRTITEALDQKKREKSAFCPIEKPKRPRMLSKVFYKIPLLILSAAQSLHWSI
jgi:hypothetical protein